MKFKLQCVPPKSTAQGSSRILRRKDGTQFIGRFANSKGQKVKDDLLLLLSEHIPTEMFKNAVSVSVVWTYPWRKSERKSNIALSKIPCTTKPDCDNICKLLFDSMTRLGFWEDDSLIADLSFKKFWGNDHGIEIEIEEIK